MTKLVDMIRKIAASIGIVACHALIMLHFPPDATQSAHMLVRVKQFH
jgi:hypothetical protein